MSNPAIVMLRPRAKREVMRVLVMGDQGSSGPVLVPFLRAAGHEAARLDLGLYEGCDLGLPASDTDRRPRLDIRDALAGYDALICLDAGQGLHTTGKLIVGFIAGN